MPLYLVSLEVCLQGSSWRWDAGPKLKAWAASRGAALPPVGGSCPSPTGARAHDPEPSHRVSCHALLPLVWWGQRVSHVRASSSERGGRCVCGEGPRSHLSCEVSAHFFPIFLCYFPSVLKNSLQIRAAGPLSPAQTAALPPRASSSSDSCTVFVAVLFFQSPRLLGSCRGCQPRFGAAESCSCAGYKGFPCVFFPRVFASPRALEARPCWEACSCAV